MSVYSVYGTFFFVSVYAVYGVRYGGKRYTHLEFDNLLLGKYHYFDGFLLLLFSKMCKMHLNVQPNCVY